MRHFFFLFHSSRRVYAMNIIQFALVEWLVWISSYFFSFSVHFCRFIQLLLLLFLSSLSFSRCSSNLFLEFSQKKISKNICGFVATRKKNVFKNMWKREMQAKKNVFFFCFKFERKKKKKMFKNKCTENCLSNGD